AKSERLSRMLKKKSVKHNVLNAVNHEAEATIIAQAGRFVAVTIATNMAGRGTDILLGGNPDFLARSDMENEWISRAAKLPAQGGAARYEDALRELREKYEEEVQRAEKLYVKEGELSQQQRSDALKRTTELQRQIREASPFREARQRYEDLSATALIEALHGMRPIPGGYLKAKEEFENSLLASSNGTETDFDEAFDEARRDFSDTLDRWQQKDGDREQLVKAPDENRQRFDEILSKYNRVCAEERERVIAAGGLHILGTERHESRRIDNQLRGRSGRQGDPGSSRFYLSLEDDLMRIFG